ncbi:MAG TPA: YraN family protein [Geobacteraceae bacterium]|nr:YraN family protein [Geobacteraceae bacterium]
MKKDCSGDRKTLGARGEEIAVAYLKRQKYRIIETNFRCRCGEVDIIARDGKTLVFVEVKTRRTASYGLPQLAVTPFKQRQISKAALTYLSKNRLMEENARFDVVSIFLLDTSPTVDHIKNAFDLAY